MRFMATHPINGFAETPAMVCEEAIERSKVEIESIEREHTERVAATTL